MSEKKKLLLNCDVCDTRKMKEEDYSHYEHIVINADALIVNEKSKSILSRLPVIINSDDTIEVEDDTEIYLKTVNGSYEITGNSSIVEHTILCVNGSLNIHPGTEEILKKYDRIIVNGNVRYPKSLEGFIGKMSVNGSTESYPDDCVILDKEFTIDKYFPLRAKEGGKYYVKRIVIIKDLSVDIAKLAGKGVHFETKRLLVPECKIEDCVPLFDESVEFIVVPDGMKLVYGDSVLNEEFVRNEGSLIFIYGDVEVDSEADLNALCNQIEKLIIKGTVSLRAEQEEAFRSINVEFDDIEIIKNNRKMLNLPMAKIDRKLLDDSPDGVKICNVAMLKIESDVSSEMILEKLEILNCAKVICSEEQESAIAAVSTNVAIIGKANDDEEDDSEEGGLNGLLGGLLGDANGILGGIKQLKDTKLINADSYVM
ncbi:MAG: hypothetical protein K2K21_14685 [Lachnospiraceae bacterium]|nr:hypothetical protein [Lachnospiraceae bacterium]